MIADYRKQKGLSQTKLAEIIGVTRYTVSNWEVGKTAPNAKELRKMSIALQVTPNDLLGVTSNGNDTKER